MNTTTIKECVFVGCVFIVFLICNQQQQLNLQLRINTTAHFLTPLIENNNKRAVRSTNCNID
jgi:hypothetical protein